MSKDSAAVMARSGKTFYRAAQLLPAESREAVMQLYRFCRLVDDLADESIAPVSSRLEGLEDLQYALQIQGNEAVLDRFGWSGDLAHRLGNTRSAAALLVRTAAGDLRFEQPADLAQLEQYAFGVAGTVGLMLCNLLGATIRRPGVRRASRHRDAVFQHSTRRYERPERAPCLPASDVDSSRDGAASRGASQCRCVCAT